jgi:hypothetical membrane protein
VRRVAIAGIVGPLVNYSIIFALGAATPHYNAVAQVASELSVGGHGWVMRANLLIFGALEALFGLVLRSRPNIGRRGQRAGTLVATAGIAFFIAGLFNIDLGGSVTTVPGAIHVLAAASIFVSYTAAAFMLRPELRDGMTGLLVRAAAWLTLPLLATTKAFSDVGGLLQRVLLGVDFAFLVSIALWLLRTSSGRRHRRSVAR